ncbi:ribbon-helix-helix protein, CopG family [Myceligenerans xiligouense]|uniref:Ribbon-helix-helix CopG family protein n=1 Tax=Myceligenerans xiligouense TaxID=253184 RepID=A0A3N4Z0Q5_9MICO|nr:ribbon-helix-helix protein, CopG family [Myceligenerans xiligouense]RPF19668.1 ribbon-helix-helix CopG family protein [Myceligenerans xiligouense]
MSHRTQITLEDEQYERLLAESRASGLGLAELVRRAIDRTYGGADVDAFTQALEASFGSLADKETDGAAYVETIRPGRGDRFAEW